MPRIVTRDEAMALRQPWLGFPGWTFPVQWTYQRWAIVGTAALVTIPMCFLVVGFLSSSFLLAALGGPLLGAALAFRFSGWAVKYLSHDQSIAYRLGMLRHAWQLYRRPLNTAPGRIEADHPTPNYLSPGARRALR